MNLKDHPLFKAWMILSTATIIWLVGVGMGMAYVNSHDTPPPTPAGSPIPVIGPAPMPEATEVHSDTILHT